MKTARYSNWITMLRVSLGFLLFLRGISFMQDSDALGSMILQTGVGKLHNSLPAIISLVAGINLLGGLFIAVGFFTRWTAIFLIPVLVVAVFLVNLAAGISNGELFLSIGALLFLIFFAIKGSGLLSADEFFRNYTHAGKERGHTHHLVNKFSNKLD